MSDGESSYSDDFSYGYHNDAKESYAISEYIDEEYEPEVFCPFHEPEKEIIVEVEDFVGLEVQNGVTAQLPKNGKLSVNAREIRESLVGAHKIFMSPSGVHIFVSTDGGDIYYFNTIESYSLCSAKYRAGVVIESVCWTDSASPKNDTTGLILMGSRTKGRIFSCEVLVKNSSDGSGGKTRSKVAQFEGWTEVLSLVDYSVNILKDSADNAENSLILGIHCETILTKQGRKTVVLVATSTCLYPFIGVTRNSVVEVFGRKCDVILRSGTGDKSKGSLSVFRPAVYQPSVSFIWTPAFGEVVHGLFAKPYVPYHPEKSDANKVLSSNFQNDEEESDFDQIIVFHEKVSLGKQHPTTSSVRDTFLSRSPKAVLATAFNMIILYDDRLVVVAHPPGMAFFSTNPSDIAARKSKEFFLGRSRGPLVGMIQDVSTKDIYFYSREEIWRMTVHGEFKGQWRPFLLCAISYNKSPILRKRFFEAAFNLTRGNAERRDLVSFAYGKFLLQMQHYEEALTQLSFCSRFEEVYNFLKKRPSLLLRFVEKRYHFIMKHKDASCESQLICLVILAVQLRLEDLSKVVDPEAVTSKLEDLEVFLRKVINSHREILKRPAVYNTLHSMLTSQGRVNTMLVVAKKLGHRHYTINYYICQAQYEKACELLIEYCSNKEHIDVWYEFAPTLICHCPCQLFEGMCGMVSKNDNGEDILLIDTVKLLPAFTKYEQHMNEYPNHSHQVVEYLHTCIFDYYEDTFVVINYYISLIAAEFNDKKLGDFLANSWVYDDGIFDKEYALRRCLEHQRWNECMTLYKRLGLYEDAVRVALECHFVEDGEGVWDGLKRTIKDIIPSNIGVSEADKFDHETLKKLWHLVARHVLQKEVKNNNTRAALEVVSDSEGNLKLEDILADIDDNTVIQNFKEPIVRSLQEYSASIQELESAEKNARATSNAIKQEKASLTHRFGYVNALQTCQLSNKGIFTGSDPFLVYPSCRHVFKEREVIRKLEELGGISAFKQEEGKIPGFLNGVRSVEDLASLECVLCGECAIIEVTKAFPEDPSWDI